MPREKAREKAQESLEIAEGLGTAFEPLIDLSLQLGITSPELESLLRMAFVRRAFQKLPRHPRTGRAPTVSRVSLATGVHRIEATRILRAGAASAKDTLERKQRLYSKSSRVLHGWLSDPKFHTSGGAPLDLPIERNRERRSFEDLVDKYAPGNFPGSVLKELKRRRNVEVLEEGIVRFRALSTRAPGVTKSNVRTLARRIKNLGLTLVQNLADDGGSARLYEETKPLALTAQHLRLIQHLLERRAKTFLDALEHELGGRPDLALHEEMKRVGVSVFFWEEEE